MLNFVNLLIVFTVIVLSGCSSAPQTRDMESAVNVQSAKSFPTHKEYANVYFARPYELNSLNTVIDVYANEEQIGELYNGRLFFNIKATPGVHHFAVKENAPEYPTMEYYNATLVQFDLEVEAGAVIIIACGDIAQQAGGKGSRYLLPPKECAKGSGRRVTTKDGVTACTEVYTGLVKKEIVWHSINYTKKSSRNCLLVTNRKIFNSMDMIKADMALIENKSASEFAKVTNINTIAAYQGYLKKYPKSTYKLQVQTSLQSLESQQSALQAELAIKAIASEEKCKIKDEDWLYIDKKCKGGYANGYGRAVNINQQNSFKGKIVNGELISGVYMLDGEVLFEGKFADGNPDGYGICMSNNEPEECRYHKGYRIDSLHKQRKELAAMDLRRQQDMSELRNEISSIKSQRNNTHTGASSITGAVANEAGKVVMDKAADRAVQELFNLLF